MATVIVKHHPSGGPADPTALVDGPTYDNDEHIVTGLENVDNTSDANKPVSTATQTALDLKANAANPSLTGQLQIATGGERIGITSSSTPLSPVSGFIHSVNDGESTAGFRTVSKWTDAGGSFTNNDGLLSENYNLVTSAPGTVTNNSWAGSFANNFHRIPSGVTDSGRRVGIIGWAGSVFTTGYQHAGTLATQIGVHGTAGFQGSGSASGAVVQDAYGVRGEIFNDTAGAIINRAYAGIFDSIATTGTVQTNYAVYARASGGTTINYSFYGAAGKFYNVDGIVGTGTNDSAAAGCVGEVITASLASGSAVSLTDATAKTVTSITLTPGDWDVSGVVGYIVGPTTSTVYFEAGTSLVDNTAGTAGSDYTRLPYGASGVVTNSNSYFTAPLRRVTVAAATTTVVYLIAKSSFSISTTTAWGTIRARRMR